MDKEKLNEKMRDFLIKSRKNAGLSQSDVAARSSIFDMPNTLDQKMVCYMEKNPISMEFIKIAAYLSAVGVSFESYYAQINEFIHENDKDTIKILRPDTAATQLRSTLKTLEQVKTVLSELPKMHQRSLKLDDINAFKSNVENIKPIIGFFGSLSVGKSTLINTIVGKNILPTSPLPVTKILNLLIHIDNKPSYINGSVGIFKKEFKPIMLFDQTLTEEYLIEAGDYSILNKLGVHWEIGNQDACVAMVFIDAEILRHVWFLDTPGNLGNDTERSLEGLKYADAIVFVSSQLNFLKSSDLGFLTQILRSNPPLLKEQPLDHVLIIQSHCHSGISDNNITCTAKNTINRIEKSLDTFIFKPWQEDKYLNDLPSQEALISRIQPFWREREEFRIQTLSKMQEMTKNVISYHESNLIHDAKQWIKELSSNVLQMHDFTKQNNEEKLQVLLDIDALNDNFNKKSAGITNEFYDLISRCSNRKKNDIHEMANFFKSTTSSKNIEFLLNEYDDLKASQLEIGSHIGQLITMKLETLLKNSGISLSNDVTNLLNKWDKMMTFNHHAYIYTKAEFSFFIGLKNVSNMGAFAISSSDIIKNHPFYTNCGKNRVQQDVTDFSVIAESIMPIVGIFVATAIENTVFRATNDSWEKTVSKKISKLLHDAEIWQQIESFIIDFWNNTEKALGKGVEALNGMTKYDINESRNEIEEYYDDDKTNQNIIRLTKKALELLKQDTLTSSDFIK